jgi:hypothetical protein
VSFEVRDLVAQESSGISGVHREAWQAFGEMESQTTINGALRVLFGILHFPFRRLFT